MPKCHMCGKFHNSGCPYYCSSECCEEAIDRMACAYGGTYEAAEAEVREICGECVC